MNARIIVLSLILFMPPSVVASSFYGGASLGYVDLGVVAANVDSAAGSAGVTGTTAELEDYGLGLKIFGGFQYNQFLGGEVAYSDLSEANVSFAATLPTATTISLDSDAGALSLALVGGFPLNRDFLVFAKLGAHYWNVDATRTVVTSGATATANADENGVDLLVGVGSNFVITPQVELRVEWERFLGIGSPTAGTDGDVDFVNMGFLYRF